MKNKKFPILLLLLLFSSLAKAINTKTIYGKEYPYFGIYSNNSKNISDQYRISCGDISDSQSEKIECFIDHIQVLKNEGICNIISFNTNKIFKYNRNYNKWMLQEEPKFFCGIIEHSFLEKEAVNKPYWNYRIERTLVNENVQFMGGTCSKSFIKQSIASNKREKSHRKIPIKCNNLKFF